jgi:peptidoglycan/LPS O-acetylase OafA/YrhL
MPAGCRGRFSWPWIADAAVVPPLSRRRSVAARSAASALVSGDVGDQRTGSSVQSRSERFPALDAIRGLAALAVVGFHSYKDVAGRPDQGGPIGTILLALDWGVPVFFVLSGFLLYWPFAAAIARGLPPPEVRSFLLRRAIRILPAYWLVLLVYGTIAAPADLWSLDGLLRYGLLQQVYQESTVYHILATAWTLSIEASFYLSLPVLAALAARLMSRRPSLARHLGLLGGLSVAMWALAGFVVEPALASVGGGTSQSGFTLAGSFEPFAAGMAVAILHVHRAELRRLPRSARGLWLRLVRKDRWWAAAAGGVLAAGLVFEGGNVMPFSSTHAATLATAILFVPLVFRPRTSRLARVLGRSRILVGLGAISYGIYLWHWPIQEIARTHGFAVSHTIGGWALSTAAIACAAIVPAWLSYRFVERPLIGWAHGRRHRFEWAGAPIAVARPGLSAGRVVSSRNAAPPQVEIGRLVFGRTRAAPRPDAPTNPVLAPRGAGASLRASLAAAQGSRGAQP